MKRIVTLIAIILFMSTSLCSAQENLNEIRFKGWTEKEWLDNDYIRELRKYINACSEGEIKDQTLLAHKEVLKSKFIVGHIEPATYGVHLSTSHSLMNRAKSSILRYIVMSIPTLRR